MKLAKVEVTVQNGTRPYGLLKTDGTNLKYSLYGPDGWVVQQLKNFNWQLVRRISFSADGTVWYSFVNRQVRCGGCSVWTGIVGFMAVVTGYGLGLWVVWQQMTADGRLDVRNWFNFCNNMTVRNWQYCGEFVQMDCCTVGVRTVIRNFSGCMDNNFCNW
jgi:hypothetical protein